MSADSINQQILALKEQLIYKQRESISKFNLSTKYIKIAKNNILTAQQNVVANQKTFNAIDKKYRARVVDNIAYLDALTRLIRSKSSYEKAKNAYQLELATYYHNRGDEISQYITKETIQ
jgi:outer membrane protein TolC